MATINLYAGTCIECGTTVAAQAGALYRHSGANMRVNGKRLKHHREHRSPYTFVVRCRACADRRPDSPWKADEAEAHAGGSPGYSEACGVWH